MDSFNQILTFVAILLLPGLSQGLSCYHCDSFKNSKTCGENPTLSQSNTELIRHDCQACVKGAYRSDRTVVYSRRCTNVVDAETECNEVEKEVLLKYKQVTCYCKEDFCNSATRTNVQTALLVILSCVAVLN